jgi:hypothetical protein
LLLIRGKEKFISERSKIIGSILFHGKSAGVLKNHCGKFKVD